MSNESRLILLIMLAVAATMFLVGLMVMSFVCYTKERMLFQHSKVSEMAKEELVKRVLQKKPYLVDVKIYNIAGVERIENVKAYMIRDGVFTIISDNYVSYIPLDAIIKVNVQEMPAKIAWEGGDKHVAQNTDRSNY